MILCWQRCTRPAIVEEEGITGGQRKKGEECIHVDEIDGAARYLLQTGLQWILRLTILYSYNFIPVIRKLEDNFLDYQLIIAIISFI